MKILLTGGAGFIGSQFLATLNTNEFQDIIIFDDITPEKLKNINQYNFSNYFDKDEIFDYIEMIQDGEEYFCFHLGAISATTYKNKDIISKNTDFTVDLIELCQKKKIPLIYASSASVYGNNQNGSYCPLNLYAFSKMLVDKHVEKYYQNPITPLIGLRFFNVVDSGNGHLAEAHKESQASVVFNWRKQLKERNYISVFNGENKRDFISVDDVCNIMLGFLTKKNYPKSGIFDVGTGCARDFNVIAAIFKERYNCFISYISMPDEIKDQYQFYTKANIPKFLEDFEFTPLEKNVNSYLDKLDKFFEKG